MHDLHYLIITYIIKKANNKVGLIILIKNKKMNNLKTLDILTLILVIVGGLNWGLVGILNFNLVATIFGDMSLLSRIIYSLVGISAIYLLSQFTSFVKK
jgi:uncharacterized membrane protein YuzA (DUF378 family)